MFSEVHYNAVIVCVSVVHYDTAGHFSAIFECATKVQYKSVIVCVSVVHYNALITEMQNKYCN